MLGFSTKNLRWRINGEHTAGRLRYVGEKVCRVRGQDHRGYPKIVLVEAHTLFEAAARGLEEICRQGGQVSELEISLYLLPR